MENAAQTNDEQATYWNGSGGHAWVEMQSVLDQVLQPFTAILLQDVPPSARHVLDVGCGAGDTTLAVAKSLGTRGQGTGIDISAPLIDAARQRAERQKIPANFVCADAADYAFSPEAFDLLISRFGVMFFGDPVKAFDNLRRASKQGAELRCIVWRTCEENPYMMTAERAARAFIPNLPLRNLVAIS